jgi:hypothetical protein
MTSPIRPKRDGKPRASAMERSSATNAALRSLFHCLGVWNCVKGRDERRRTAPLTPLSHAGDVCHSGHRGQRSLTAESVDLVACEDAAENEGAIRGYCKPSVNAAIQLAEVRQVDDSVSFTAFDGDAEQFWLCALGATGVDRSRITGPRKVVAVYSVGQLSPHSGPPIENPDFMLVRTKGRDETAIRRPSRSGETF